MTSNSPPDVSLYELVLQSELPPTALQIGPTTLKSVSDTLLQLLTQEKIPAIVWAKLPRGDAWWQGIEQYTKLPNVAQAVYLFAQQRDDADDITGATPAQAEKKFPSAIATAAPVPVVSVQLPADNPLRREYFLIVWSAQLQIGLFAHRPRSVHPHKLPDNSLPSLDWLSGSYGQTAQLVDVAPERKQLLLALCSFTPKAIQPAIQELEQAIAPSFQRIELSTSSSGLNATTAAQLGQHWQLLLQSTPATSSNSHWLGQIFSRQLQIQEDGWQRSATYRKQAETAEHLRLQTEDLTTTLRLKDDFLNNVGQELRTPLTTIKTALSLLNSPNIKPPQRQRYMDLIAKECDRQNSLITSLLDLTQLDQEAEQAALPPVRLVDVVPGVVSTYQPIAEEKGVRLSYTVPEDLPPVACMTNWIKQIVINLLHNGIKYTLNGGNVWVRAKQQGDYIQLEVRDTGIGIAPSEIPKIFDRFYRVRQSADDSSGAGLGLTIVQQLLLHCGGSISVKSKLAEGSTFNVLLPIYKNPAEIPS